MEDWRVTFADDVNGTRGMTFQRKPYRAWSEGWDHDRRVACTAKLSEDPTVGLTEGYASAETSAHAEGYHWTCPTCFDELRAELDWHGAPDREP